MSFKEDIQKLAVQINERKQFVTNEEMTKQALIIPFIQILGFDVFNPIEVRPEFFADFGKKKGEKVDYALFKDNNPIIFVEAKAVNENLSNHDAQLSRYFNAVTDVKLAILTNGVDYKFFTDLTSDNIMDDTPFLQIDITNLKDSDIENLNKFRKDSFNKENLIKYAEELLYTYALNDTLRELFKNPSDEFIRFLIKDFSDTRVTTNVIERFRPLVKKSISNAVLEIVSKGLYQDDTEEQEHQAICQCNDEVEDHEEIEVKKKSVVTTDEELRAFEIIREILTDASKDITGLNYKDTTNYFSIYVNNITKWFLRLNLDSAKKNIMIKLDLESIEQLKNDFEVDSAPKGIATSRIYINSVDDLKSLKDLIIACFEQI